MATTADCCTEQQRVERMRRGLMLFAPGVAMVQTAQTRNGNQSRLGTRPLCQRAAIRCVLFQRVVNSVLVIIAHVIPDQPTQMLLIQRNHMVENLAAATAHPPFRHTMLPGRPWARSLGLQPRCLQE